MAAPGDAQIAAGFKAIFGDAAALCVQGDGQGGPAAPVGDCDHCPLCRFAAQAAALIAPDSPDLLIGRDAAAQTLGGAYETGAFPRPPTKQSRARAPPFAV